MNTCCSLSPELTMLRISKPEGQGLSQSLSALGATSTEKFKLHSCGPGACAAASFTDVWPLRHVEHTCLLLAADASFSSSAQCNTNTGLACPGLGRVRALRI